MLCHTFKINYRDYTKWAHKYGLSTSYQPIQGLPDKYTVDGTLHDDILTNKATYTIRLNPLPPGIAREILTEYRSNRVVLTVHDVATGLDKTMLCKAGTASGVVAMVKNGTATYWQLEDLEFIEK